MSEIIVNGRKFDAQTGQPIDAAEALIRGKKKKKNLHQSTEKSKTLNRRFVKAPSNTQANMISQFKRRHDEAEFEKMRETFEGVSERKAEKGRVIPRRNAHRVLKPVSRDDSMASKKQPKTSKNSDAIQPYKPHPLQEKAYAQMRARREGQILPSMNEIKQNAIAFALNRMSREVEAPAKPRKKKILLWALGGLSVVAVVVVVAIVSNLPAISARVASAQSGFSATIPEYAPQNYKLTTLPYSDGKSIVMRFSKADTHYELRQSESAWDSAFLREAYVVQNFGKDFETYKERGITIFRSSDERAAWVNGGRLYELKADEHFVGEELVGIATSF